MGEITVRDLMTERVLTVSRATSLREVRELVHDGNFRHVPVVDGDELVGVVSDRDLARVLGRRTGTRADNYLDEVAVGLVMTVPVETADPDEPARDAGERMLEAKYGCLPVVEGRVLVGILIEQADGSSGTGRALLAGGDLVIIALALAGPSPPLTSRMHDRFAALGAVRDAVVDGDLAAVRVAADGLATDPTPGWVPLSAAVAGRGRPGPRGRRHGDRRGGCGVRRLPRRGGRPVRRRPGPSAARRLPRRGPGRDVARPPHDGGRAVGWAPRDWARSHTGRLAERALDTDRPDERTAITGPLLSTCSACHSNPGVRDARR